jgi:hypothetical protein
MRLAPVLALVLALAVPAGAVARPRDLLHGAKLESATGTLTISESRCAQGSTANCGEVRLQEKFKTGPKPGARTTAGRTGFSAGVRINGAGTGECSAQSPTSLVTGPDGSQQFLGAASSVEPGKFAVTRVALAGGRRGVRIAWLEPIAPGFDCDYFNERGTSLRVPAAARLQSSLVRVRVLKRSRFSVTIAGSKKWTRQESDGTQVSGLASWRLRLTYKR